MLILQNSVELRPMFVCRVGHNDVMLHLDTHVNPIVQCVDAKINLIFLFNGNMLSEAFMW
jgi:hypothetical protein